MNDSAYARDKSVTSMLMDHFHETESETLSQDSRATSYTALPDYLLVRRVVTDVYPIPATAAINLTTDKDSQALDIPVRVPGHREHQQLSRLV